MTLEQTIAVGFASLESIGFRMPASYGTDDGLQNGIRGFALILEDLTTGEVEGAFSGWMKTEGPWFPTPGQLRATVPHMAESEAEWRAISRGRGSSIALLVQRSIGSGIDSAGFRGAFREFSCRWVALSDDERKAIGVDMRKGQHAAIVAAGLLEAPLRLVEGGG